MGHLELIGLHKWNDIEVIHVLLGRSKPVGFRNLSWSCRYLDEEVEPPRLLDGALQREGINVKFMGHNKILQIKPSPMGVVIVVDNRNWEDAQLYL